MPRGIRRRITSARRDEIEKEQHQLSQAINRPFETVAGLPISYNKPPEGHYEDVLKQPLTVKDLGVLYTSLLRSRHNYVFSTPMFKLYWVKQSSYAKKLADLEKAKEKNAAVRLPVPRKTTNLSNAYTASSTKGEYERFPVLPNDVSARDAMVKLCDSSLTLGPHAFEIRLFILKDGRPEKLPKKRDPEYKLKQAYAQGYSPGIPMARPLGASAPYATSSGASSAPSGANGGAKIPDAGSSNVSVGKKPEAPSVPKKLDDKPEAPSVSKKLDDKPETPSVSKKLDDKPVKTSVSSTAATEKTNEIKSDSKKTDSKKMSDKNSPSKKELAKKDTGVTNEKPTEDAGAKKDAKSPSKTSGASSSTEKSTGAPVSSESNAPATTRPPSPSGDMQSIENTIMISNLNSIAREDASLNALMKIVALGTASSEQIIEFKTYIEKAKAMGPQPHHAYLFDKSTAAQKYFLERLKYGMKDSQMAFKDKKIPKLRLPRDQKLTAFQERYLDNATLLFEFVENPNVRFLLPQDSICEVMDPADPIVEDEDDEEPTEYKDILISTLWVHNVAEVEKYQEKLAEYERLVKEREEKKRLEEDEAKKKEEAERKAADGEAAGETEGGKETGSELQPAENGEIAGENVENDGKETVNGEGGDTEAANAETGENATVTPDVEQNGESTSADPAVKTEAEEPKARSFPNRKTRSKKKGRPPPRAPTIKKVERPVEPEIKFTAFSFTIHNIPARYVPIVMNSMKPVEEVQKRMEHILKTGTRLNSFYLWYQVDGKLDEKLAEGLRNGLVQEEKKMPGVAPALAITKEPKKRKIKDKTIVRPKKMKVEDVPGQPASTGVVSGGSFAPPAAPSGPPVTGGGSSVGLSLERVV